VTMIDKLGHACDWLDAAGSQEPKLVRKLRLSYTMLILAHTII
jgi:hypothetical protein